MRTSRSRAQRPSDTTIILLVLLSISPSSITAISSDVVKSGPAGAGPATGGDGRGAAAVVGFDAAADASDNGPESDDIESLERALVDELKRARYSSFSGDIGDKRSNDDHDAELADADIDVDRRAISRVRGKAFKADLGKRVRGAMGMFRADLGRRSADGEARDPLNDEDEELVDKRRPMSLFRADLGKRSAEQQQQIDRAELIRRMFRSAQGKRRMFRHDLG